MADPTTGLLDALLAVQREVPALPKDSVNPHFKARYTSLDSIVENVGPILAKHGLVWVTMPCRDETGAPSLRYRLAHVATGEVLEGVMPLLLVKQDPQGLGSALTYARRYSLTNVLNLIAADDDDGRLASTAPKVELADNKEIERTGKALMALYGVEDEDPAQVALDAIVADLSGVLPLVVARAVQRVAQHRPRPEPVEEKAA